MSAPTQGVDAPPGEPPCVLALPLGQAQGLLAAAGWLQVEVRPTLPTRPRRETVPAPKPSEQEEWRVIRQRRPAPNLVELLVAPEMRPTV